MQVIQYKILFRLLDKSSDLIKPKNNLSWADFHGLSKV